MFKIYFRDKNKKRINEEPLIAENKPLYGSRFCLSLNEDSITMRVIDSIHIFDVKELSNGTSYYVDVSPYIPDSSKTREFTSEELEIIKRDIKEQSKLSITNK